MKELLIIRSVSFQQLDLNLPEIRKKFPNHNISILTHEHGVELAKKYKEISKIYVYTYSGSFDRKNKIKEFENKTFDVIIVPVTNITGASFLNVLTYGITIKAKEYYMCNVVSDIQKLSKSKIARKKAKGIFCSIVAGISSMPLIIIGIPILLIKLKQIKKK